MRGERPTADAGPPVLEGVGLPHPCHRPWHPTGDVGLSAGLSVIPSLAVLVERNPALYDALRARDSAANHVCEVLARNGQVRQLMEVWKRTQKQVKREVEKAIAMEENGNGREETGISA